MEAIAKAAPLLGRILLATIFLQAGIAKLGAPGHTVAMMASHGIPQPHLLVFGVIALELGGGLLLIAGWHARLVALVLCFYTLTLALIFHAYWTATGGEVATQRALFFGHLSMMGGMLYVVAFGPGPLSVDEAAHSRGAHRFFRLMTR
jgi:putative oxidoreductase